ncbi:MAG: type IX secretion system membrane protein PorP/SprF [Flavobacteriales bacterium]|jgi:type IX secretion system PorP/SprF family membrane protein|nr:type IX secretion system membrane protein PorP/SprF [Flavobacteriales bacterium]
MRKKVVLFLAGLCACLTSYCQDPEFTQFYANPIYLNPAMAGSNICPRFRMNHRNQWANISGAYVTSSASWDRYYDALHGGVGVMITNDMAGKNTINWNSINLVYSYYLKVTRNFSILMGAQAGWNQKFLDWNKLAFGDQIDPRDGFVYATNDIPSGRLLKDRWGTRGFFDVSAGIVAYSKKVYGGVALKHLNTPNQSLKLGRSDLPIRLTTHIGFDIPVGTESKYVNTTSFSPNIIYTYQDGFMQLNMGTYFKHGVFTAGFWWRTSRRSDSVILTTGIQSGTMKIGYSYDITVSELTNVTGGSHELSLGVDMNCKIKKKNFRTISCPSF